MGGWRREAAEVAKAAEAAGYRTKNKNSTQRCGEKRKYLSVKTQMRMFCSSEHQNSERL